METLTQEHPDPGGMSVPRPSMPCEVQTDTLLPDPH